MKDIVSKIAEQLDAPGPNSLPDYLEIEDVHTVDSFEITA